MYSPPLPGFSVEELPAVHKERMMSKQKTHKGLAKRVKVTGTGKVRRYRSGASHLMSTKNAKRRRRLASSTLVKGANVAKIKALLGA